ncbi:MAG: hypothetical protein RLZZ231_664 [Bacteroidota bacterium]|jgi:hypothetical protein
MPRMVILYIFYFWRLKHELFEKKWGINIIPFSYVRGK